MRKIYVFWGMAFALMFFFASCQQDLEIWDSETLNYSGRYVVKLMNEDMSTVHHDYDGSELRFYNTSSNIQNEIWLEDVAELIPLKCKAVLTGAPELFKSSSLKFEELSDNLKAIGTAGVALPTAEGQTVEVKRDYLRAAIAEGKIIPNVVKTKGGNTADSIYVKVVLYSGKVVFKSQAVPEKDWKDPTKPEYIWKLSSLIYDSSKDETLVIGGYRYTGFIEDEY